MATKTYRCKRSFVIGVNGTNRAIRAGDIIAAGDPRFRKYKHLLGDPKFFEDSEDYIGRTIEQATAAPGEKRTVAPPAPTRKAAKAAKKAAKTKADKGKAAEQSSGEPEATPGAGAGGGAPESKSTEADQ